MAQIRNVVVHAIIHVVCIALDRVQHCVSLDVIPLVITHVIMVVPICQVKIGLIYL